MAHSTNLDDVEKAVAFAVRLDVLKFDPAVHQRGKALVGALEQRACASQAGEHRGDVAGLQEIDHPQKGRMDLGSGTAEGGNGVDDDDGGLKRLDVAVDARKMHLQTVEVRPGRVECAVGPLRCAFAGRVRWRARSCKTLRRFLPTQAPCNARRAGKPLRRSGWRRSSCPSRTLPTRVCSIRDRPRPCRAFCRGPGFQSRQLSTDTSAVSLKRSRRKDADAVFVDEKGIFVGSVGGATIFDDPQSARRDLVHDAVVEQDDAVGNVFFEAMPGQLPVASFAGDDRSEAPVFDPAEKPPQLRAQHAFVGKARKQRLYGVQHHALGADRVDGKTETDEKTLEVVFPRLLDFAPLDPDMVDGKLARGDQGFEIVAERADICGEIFGALLEAHEDPGLAESATPCTRNVRPNRVFPDPAAPQMRVGLPAGRPPKVIASNPAMPVGAFAIPESGGVSELM